ncbi:PREDICTED: uncharacterized protein LOC108554525, partial [Eufriesea mexicana]|uniref:uncharacterized protein LOC108554525 n=1 Tax=Eufriesea mexicana TaxID=516756 RepID=UPI00083C0DC1
MYTSKEKMGHILQFFFDKGENTSQADENLNSVYGSVTVTANHAQFWFRLFRSGNFNVKDAPRFGRPIVENINKIMEIVESDRHDKAGPHASIVTRQKLREHVGVVLMHPPYSPDLAPSNYHLLLSMANDFA